MTLPLLISPIPLSVLPQKRSANQIFRMLHRSTAIVHPLTSTPRVSPSFPSDPDLVMSHINSHTTIYFGYFCLVTVISSLLKTPGSGPHKVVNFEFSIRVPESLFFRDSPILQVGEQKSRFFTFGFTNLTSMFQLNTTS